MAADLEQRPAEPGRSGVDKARFWTRIGLGALAVAAVVWFTVANSQKVSVDWFVVETRSPLFLVILLSALLGALADRLIRWRRSRRS